MKLSKRMDTLGTSITLKAAHKARVLIAEGKDVMNLTVGEPDFPTPKNIQTAAISAIETGKASYYTATPGIPQLRQAIENRLKLIYGLDMKDENIVVTDGAKFALYTLFQVIIDPEDEVLIPVPYWVSYSEQVKVAGGVPVFVQPSTEDLKVTVDDLEAMRSNKTVAVIINSPSNPSGAVYSYEELKAIGEWAVEKNVLIISDDIYGRLVYNGNNFTPIATISDEIYKNTVIINGVSKAYSMTGWRIGFAAGNKEIIQQMIKLCSQSTSNPTAVSQFAAVEAFNGSQDCVEVMRQAYEDRLNEIFPIVKEIPGFKLQKPHGAFYLFPDISEALEKTGMQNATEFVDKLLSEELVAIVTGAGFGMDKHVRLSYATDIETLKTACKRMTDFIQRHSKSK
ncbi:MAG: pyridoxal phosphate-dependent aminotransferase [Streptococcaceae bacterium]|jgi:aspartate/methionine/tyrosine aminotransferase|nr:pyridoxal phosphate-dependent aminotransferase [Streptococcaceae bacterium]